MSEKDPREVLKTSYLTVYQGMSEVIVFGDGSDWIVRYSRTTNYRDSWRKWFGKRELAEEFALEISSKSYEGRFGYPHEQNAREQTQ